MLKDGSLQRISVDDLASIPKGLQTINFGVHQFEPQF